MSISVARHLNRYPYSLMDATKPTMSKLKLLTPILFSFVMAAGYGLFVRLAFGSEQFSTLFGTVSIGFLFVVPAAIGGLTQYFALPHYRTHWLYAFFAPWAPCFIFSGLAVALSWEAWICVVMALPLFFMMSTIGGLLICWFFFIPGYLKLSLWPTLAWMMAITTTTLLLTHLLTKSKTHHS